MNVSLLDLLSCGLAVVVILLVVSLNSGMGSRDKVDEATLVEVTAYGVVKLVEPCTLQWRKTTKALKYIPISEKNEAIVKLNLPSTLDSILGVGSVLYQERQTYLLDEKQAGGIKQEFTFPRKARGVRLAYNLEKYGLPNDSILLGFKITKKFGESIETFTEPFPTNLLVELKYDKGLRIAIRSAEDQKKLFSFRY